MKWEFFYLLFIYCIYIVNNCFMWRTERLPKTKLIIITNKSLLGYFNFSSRLKIARPLFSGVRIIGTTHWKYNNGVLSVLLYPAFLDVWQRLFECERRGSRCRDREKGSKDQAEFRVDLEAARLRSESKIDSFAPMPKNAWQAAQRYWYSKCPSIDPPGANWRHVPISSIFAASASILVDANMEVWQFYGRVSFSRNGRRWRLSRSSHQRLLFLLLF